MITPSDTQSLILSRAATRPGNLAVPLPEGLAGAAGVACELLVFTAPFEVLWQRVKRRNDQEEANAVRLTESRLRLYVDGFDWPAEDEGARVIATG